MSIETLASLAAGAAGGAGGATTLQLGPVTAPAGGGDQFAMALSRAGHGSPAQAVAPSAATGGSMPSAVKGLFNALDGINTQARSVSDYAATAEASGGTLTPGEIVQLTMKCQEFMFQCQLTSNIANRSSDGVQQLFKQQG